MSRNRFIVRALERAIYEETEWSEPFMNELTAAARDIEGHRDVDEMRVAISSARRSKAPPKL